MNPFYHSSTPLIPGSLHDLTREHDNCGMGAIAHLHGQRSREILDLALESVCCMTHRGAVDADMKTGDGAGVLTQLPFPLFKKEAEKLGYIIDNEGELAVGVFFLPAGDAKAKQELEEIVTNVFAKRSIERIGWREVPVNIDALGQIARQSRPDIRHLLLKRPEGLTGDDFERRLYLCRREIERLAAQIPGFYVPTLSSRLISYKALAMPAALRAFYQDFSDPD